MTEIPIEQVHLTLLARIGISQILSEHANERAVLTPESFDIGIPVAGLAPEAGPGRESGPGTIRSQQTA